jgi:hypothetical protein
MPLKRTKSRGRKQFRKRTSKSPGRFKRTKRSRSAPRKFKSKLKKGGGVIVCRSGGGVGAGNSSQNFLGKGVTAHPSWWKTLLRGNTPTSFAGQHGRSFVQAGQNLKNPIVFWKHVGIYDVQTALTYDAGSSLVAPTSNAFKNYMFDYVREQSWRNASPAAIELEFYVLAPRERIPYSSSIVNAGVARKYPQIAPVGSNIYDADFLEDPPMYIDSLSDMSGIPGGGANKIGSRDQGATPFMSPSLTALFKIKPLSMTWPNGQKGYKGRLEAGQEITLTTHRPKPMMVSFNKFGLDSVDNYALQNTYQVLRETPLIFMYYKGTMAHEVSTGLGPIQTCRAWLDWKSTQHFRFVQAQISLPSTNHYTVLPTALVAPTQILPVTGAAISVP